jgi:hypothetical protein
VAGRLETAMVPDVPLIVPSEAVIVWFPAVAKVIQNVPVPFERVELAGRLADPSVLENLTVPV